MKEKLMVSRRTFLESAGVATGAGGRGGGNVSLLPDLGDGRVVPG